MPKHMLETIGHAQMVTATGGTIASPPCYPPPYFPPPTSPTFPKSPTYPNFPKPLPAPTTKPPATTATDMLRSTAPQ